MCALAFCTTELLVWWTWRVAVSECDNHLLPQQWDYAGLQPRTFTLQLQPAAGPMLPGQVLSGPGSAPSWNGLGPVQT